MKRTYNTSKLNIIVYASLFSLLILILLFKYYIHLIKYNYLPLFFIILFSLISFIIFILGSDFEMLNVLDDLPNSIERVFSMFMGGITWWLFFGYFFSLIINNIYISVIVIIIMGIIILLKFGDSTKSLGITIILPFFILSLITLFFKTFSEFGSRYGYFYGILMIAIEIAILSIIIFFRMRTSANYILSLIFFGGVFYGILLEGNYFGNNIIFYLISSIILIISFILITHFELSLNFTDMTYSRYFKFTDKNLIGYLLLGFVIVLFTLGFILITPYYGIIPKNVLINYFLMWLFLGAVFYFMNISSSNAATNTITFVLVSAVALYGLYFLISITPPSIIGNSTPKNIFWLVFMFLIMYEPSFNLLKYVTNAKISSRFSMTFNIQNWLKRAKVMKGKHGYYELKNKIKEGGTANIYRAYDIQNNRDVIIKIPVIICRNCNYRMESIPTGEKCPNCKAKLNTIDFKEATEILKKEIDALLLLKSPHIVQQLDNFTWGGKTYLVEEMIDGDSFTDLFYQKPITEKEMLNYIKKALNGINYAHMRGIIHRDLNTGNLMIEHKSNDVKIIDFGTAKFKSRLSYSEGKPSIGSKFGTDYFSPPESSFINYAIKLIPNKEPTFSYDIYSLGCIMYFMLKGEFPKDLVSNINMIYPYKTTRMDFKNELSSKCTNHCLSIILKATQFNPDDRYQSAFEMLCDIENIKGEFIVTNIGDAFSLPAIPNSSFFSEIQINFKKQLPSVKDISFNKIAKSIDINLRSNVLKEKKIKYNIIYDSVQKQYKLSPGSYKLYYWYFDKDGKIVQKQVKDTGVYLGRKVMLFSPSDQLFDVAFAYYRSD